MNLKTLLVLGASVVMSISASAWTKPVPQTQDLVQDGETAQYIYNVGAGMFLVGANNYNTRASVASNGYQWKITDNGDGALTLSDHVEKGNDGADKGWLAMFCDNNASVWVDNLSGANVNTWTLTAVGDGKYQIGNQGLPDEFLGVGVEGVKGTDTRCYFTSYFTAQDPVLEAYYEWTGVSVEEYEAYLPKVEQYNAAVSLEAAIEEAEAAYPGIDLSAQKAVYNNESSTTEELAAAEASIKESISAYLDAQLNNATLANPVEYTSKIMDGNVCSAVANWSREFTGTGSTGSLSLNTWSVEGSSDGTGVLTPFIENWVSKGSTLSDQICHIDTVDVLPGAYKITARVRLYNESGAESISGASLFGNFQQKTIVDPSKEVSSDISTGEEGYFSYNSMLGYYAPAAETYAVVGNDGKLTFGIKVKDANYNWQAHKDYKVYYLGTSDESVLAARNTEMSIEGVGEDVAMTQSLKDQLNGYVETYKNSSSASEIMEALANYNAEIISEEVAENKAAWADFVAAGAKAKTIINDENYAAVAGELSDEYFNYFNEDGTVLEYTMTTEEVKAETEKLLSLIEETKDKTPAGTDVTDKFITNGNFASGWTGWSHSGTGGNVAADSGAKCAEAWNSANFDIHQDITSAPAGMYEVQVQGFYRYLRGDNAWLEYFNEDGSQKTENVSPYIQETPAKIYLNDNTNPMANVFDYSVTPDYATEHWTAGNYYTDPNGTACYPNNMTDAGEAFDQGYYAVSTAGAVAEKGDVLRIGMKGNSNQGGDSWAIFTRFKLTYQGYRMKYIAPEVAKQIAYLDTLSQPMGSDVKAQVEAVKEALSAIDTNTEYDESVESKDNFTALCDAYTLKNKVISSVAIFAELAAENAALEEAMGNTEASEETQGAAGELNAAVAEGIEAGEWTDAEATAKIAEIKKMIKKLAIPANIEEASPENPVDLTTFIENPSFETGSFTGWTQTGLQTQSNTSFGKTGTYYCEKWHVSATLDVHQTIDMEVLPAGKYMITVDDYCDEVVEGALYAVVGTDSVSTLFSAHESALSPATDAVTIDVPAGQKLTIGACGTLTTSTWFTCDNFKLYCIGVNAGKKGDVTGDGNVDIADVNAIISVICGGTENAASADVTADGTVDIADVNAVIAIICGN